MPMLTIFFYIYLAGFTPGRDLQPTVVHEHFATYNDCRDWIKKAEDTGRLGVGPEYLACIPLDDGTEADIFKPDSTPQ